MKIIRFNISTALIITALIAWTLAWIRALDAVGILMGQVVLLLLVAAYLVAIKLTRRYSRPQFGSYGLPLWIGGYALIPLLYFASMGPAIWVCARYCNADSQNPTVLHAYNAIYEPAATCIVDVPIEAIHDLAISYLRWWMPDGTNLHRQGRNYLGLHSVSKTNPNRSINLRLPCYFTFGG